MAVGFIEEKPVRWEYVQNLLQKSVNNNHWTNFGPVSKYLETEIARLLALDSGLCVVACCNASIAMHALVQFWNWRIGKIYFAVSSYGFPCSFQGPLQGCSVVDCDKDGMLDLECLKNETGIIVTNLFGLHENMQKYTDYCRDNKKICIIDSATGFDGIKHSPNEVISFHHTKPWGFGEGGCVIIEKEWERPFRNMINCGLLTGEGRTDYATNGKMSDISAAFILQRFMQMPEIKPIYTQQYERIKLIASKIGYKVKNMPGTSSHVPLLGDKSRTTDEHIVTRKYYQPLKNTPNASRLYERIINIPCHPGMAQISDDIIKSVLACTIS